MKDDKDKETSFRACKHNLFKQVVSKENDNNNKENKEKKTTENLTLTTVPFVSKIPLSIGRISY